MFWGAVVSRAVGVRRRVLAVHSTGLWKKGSSFSWSDRLVLRSYDRIVALARTHADYLVEREKLPRDRICVINNGVDTSRFRPAESEAERLAAREALGIVRGSFVVTAVAALRPEKNHSMLLASASRMLERRRDFVVLIVGEGPEEAKLRAMTRDRALEEHVRFMGRTNDVSTLLRAADASVLCSHGIVETFPLAVLEAMASGLPVVATDVGALREMLADGREGFIVPRGDVEALTATLLMLAEQPEDARRVGRSARERIVRDFSEERMLRGYADLFRDVRTDHGCSHRCRRCNHVPVR
jgi:glycosyltransferase involved in cell wall biosynthesis